MADSELEKNKKRGKRECIMKGLERMEIARERERGGGGSLREKQYEKGSFYLYP